MEEVKKVGLIKRIAQFFNKLFKDGMDILRKNSIVAVKTTGFIKDLVENPAVELIVDWTKTDLDDQTLEKLQAVMPGVAMKVAIAHGILEVINDDSDAIGAIIAHLQTILPSARTAFWLVLSGEINVALADGKISFAEGVALAQLVYVELKN